MMTRRLHFFLGLSPKVQEGIDDEGLKLSLQWAIEDGSVQILDEITWVSAWREKANILNST